MLIARSCAPLRLMPVGHGLTYPMASNSLAYFISVSLIVFPDRALSFKGFTPYYTQSVGTKNSYVFKTSRRSRIVRVVFSSIFPVHCVTKVLDLPFWCRDSPSGMSPSSTRTCLRHPTKYASTVTPSASKFNPLPVLVPFASINKIIESCSRPE